MRLVRKGPAAAFRQPRTAGGGDHRAGFDILERGDYPPPSRFVVARTA
jgi:hypothetical protein